VALGQSHEFSFGLLIKAAGESSFIGSSFWLIRVVALIVCAEYCNVVGVVSGSGYTIWRVSLNRNIKSALPLT